MITLVSALATCIIVVSPGTNGNVWEKYLHERAHCNGWVHPEQVAPKRGTGYKAFRVPPEFNYAYPGPKRLLKKTTREAQELCGGHYACMWFEEN